MWSVTLRVGSDDWGCLGDAAVVVDGSPGGRAGTAIAARDYYIPPGRPGMPLSLSRAVDAAASGQAAAPRYSVSTSAGVLHPSVLRGRPFNAAATAASSSALCRARSVPLGKYWRNEVVPGFVELRWTRVSRAGGWLVLLVMVVGVLGAGRPSRRQRRLSL